MCWLFISRINKFDIRKLFTLGDGIKEFLFGDFFETGWGDKFNAWSWDWDRFEVETESDFLIPGTVKVPVQSVRWMIFEAEAAAKSMKRTSPNFILNILNIESDKI